MISKAYLNYIEECDIANLKSDVYHINSPEFRTGKIMDRLRHTLHYAPELGEKKDWIDVMYVDVPNSGRTERIIILQCIPENIVDTTYPTQDWKNYDSAFWYIADNLRITFTEMRTTKRKMITEKCDNAAYVALSLSDGQKIRLWETPIFLMSSTKPDMDLYKNKELIKDCMFHKTFFYYIIGCFE